MRRVRQVAKLRAYHYTAQTRPEKKHMSRFGLDLISGTVRNNVDAGVLEPVLAKIKIIQARAAGSAARCQLVQQPVGHAPAAWLVTNSAIAAIRSVQKVPSS